MSEVSVILPAYHEPLPVFRRAVDSILNQSFKDFELLLILDDPNNQELKRAIESYRESDCRVKVLYNERNLGLVGTLNRAIESSTGSYICRMDADDISDLNRIELQLSFLKAHDFDLVGGFMHVIDETGEPLYLIDSVPQSADGIANGLRWNNCVPHPTWFGKRCVFEQRYRPVPFAEDYDFLIRAVLSGYKLGNVDRPVLSYRKTVQSISRSNLFKQMLVQKALVKSYRHGRTVDPIEVSNLVEHQYSESKAIGYTKADALFNSALTRLKSKHVASAVHLLIKVIFVSPEYTLKMVHLLMASLYK